MKKIIVLLLFFCMISCKKEKNSMPIPVRVYEREGVIVKSFDFVSFEPYLKRDNDTTYVVNFWATWCVPCIEELPHFEKLNASYKDKKVKVLLVSLDMPQKVTSNLLSFIKKNNLQSEVVYLNDPDANVWISKVDSLWSGALPATLIYKGKKRKFYEQSFTYETIEREVQSFLK